MNKNSWYVLFVMSGKEKAICDFMNKEANIIAFYPQVETSFKKEGKRIFVTKPLFPSYIFIETPLSRVSFIETLKEIKAKKSGIVKELKYDNEGTTALSDEEQTFLESLMDKKKVVAHSQGFIENDQIIITEGPLQGFESYIVNIDRHKRTALISFEMLGKEVNVRVALEIVKKI